MAIAVDSIIRANNTRMFRRTVNIPGLRGAGELFKYGGSMPSTWHYRRIDQDIAGSCQAICRALSKKIRSEDII